MDNNMVEDNRYGHRQRMRDQYINAGEKSMDDHKLLELYLALVIPRKDVRGLAYRLIDTFGSLKGVFDADVEQLMRVNGVGENTAVLISVSKDIANRIDASKSDDIKTINSSSIAIRYANNLLSNCVSERLLVVALDNKCRVLNKRLFDGIGINFMDANIKGITEFLLMTKATNVIVAHNHPDGYMLASASDCNFTINFRDMMHKLGINLIDHIIVGNEGGMSMRSQNEYKNFFGRDSIIKEYEV